MPIRPKHLAFIMDGNSSWARCTGAQQVDGYRAGMKNLVRIVLSCRKIGIKYATFYVFSTENWKRPQKWLNSFMRLAQDFFDADESVQKFFDSDVKLVLIGNITKLSPEFQSALKAAVEKTAGKEGMTVCLAVNYGGRDEIVRSIKRLQEQKLEMNEQNVNNNLDTRGIPDPDMIIRTGNQQRLSNFLLWQSSYSELYFSNIPWPDFSEAHLETAIRDFLGRKRTYGK